VVVVGLCGAGTGVVPCVLGVILAVFCGGAGFALGAATVTAGVAMVGVAGFCIGAGALGLGFSTMGFGGVARAFSMATLRARISSADSMGSSDGVAGGVGALTIRSLPFAVAAAIILASVASPLEDGCVGGD
jgi:hypothetical protein